MSNPIVEWLSGVLLLFFIIAAFSQFAELLAWLAD